MSPDQVSPFMTPGQETERVYPYNPGAQTRSHKMWQLLTVLHNILKTRAPLKTMQVFP